MKSPIRLMPWLVCVLALSLTGCALGLGELGAKSADMTTESDETPTQRRARIRLELASAYFQQGQTRVALDEIKQAIGINPTYADAYNLRGLVYLRLNDMPLAVESFERALILNPRDADTAHNYGWLLCQQSRFVESEKLFAQAIANPGYSQPAKTWMAQGLCQSRAGRPDHAEASLSRAHLLDTDNPVTRYHLARLQFERKDFLPAQSHLRKLNSGSQGNAETLWLGIRVERQLNNPAAVADLAKQLRGRFAQSRELKDYDRGVFHD
jgi:type IV pilus assembly protein PilF